MCVSIIATLSLFAVAGGPSGEDYQAKEFESMPLGGSFIYFMGDGGVSSRAGDDAIPIVR